jgi:hypothetical protein
MGGECSTNGRREMHILARKPEGSRPLERPRRRWVDNIIMDLREIECDGMDFIEVAQDRDQLIALVNTVMNLLVQLNSGKFLSGCAIGGFLGRV